MNLSFSEMFFIFLLALIIFGPKKLPEIGRQIGKALAEFKRYSNDFKYQLESEVRQWEIEDTLRKEKESLNEAISLPEGTIPNIDLNPNPEQASTSAPEAPEGHVDGSALDASSVQPQNSPSKEPNA